VYQVRKGSKTTQDLTLHSNPPEVFETPDSKSASFQQRTQTMSSYLPKRISELPELEEESSDEEKNSLNNAMLNRSFFLTPSKVAEDMQDLVANDENNQNQPNSNAIQVQDVLADSLENLKLEPQNGSNSRPIRQQLFAAKKPGTALQEISDETTKGGKISIFSHLKASATKSPSKISTITFRKKSLFSEAIERAQSFSGSTQKENPVATPLVRIKSLESEHLINDHASPVKSDTSKGQATLKTPYAQPAEHQFVTPQVKTFQTMRLQSSRVKSSQKTLDNQFRSQKILFTTPIAVSSRPPVALSIKNDSICLSLEDTPEKSTQILKPQTAHKNHLSPIKESSAGKEPAKDVQMLTINHKQYVIDKKIGSGGSSSVFLARQTCSDLECAVKCVNLEGDASVVEGYLNETRLLAKLQGNVNVVKLYD
jgi:hypothetical protein